MRQIQKLFAGLLALGLCIGLAGCGFQPIYADKIASNRPLNYIDVAQVDGRDGYFMTRELDRILTPGNAAAPKTHDLKISVVTIKRNALVSLDEVALRNDFLLRVEYELIDKESQRTALQGRNDVSSAPDEPGSPYSAIAADMAAEERVAKLAAEQLRIRLLAASARGAIP